MLKFPYPHLTALYQKELKINLLTFILNETDGGARKYKHYFLSMEFQDTFRTAMDQ